LRRLDSFSSDGCNGNGNNDRSYGLYEHDDDYYLDIGSEPPRFAYYIHIRIEKSNDEHRKKSNEAAYDSTITQDELDYALKRKLRITPEARYQHEKRHYYWHELYTEGGRECNPMYNGCTPNCRFYPEFGVITDEVIEDHNRAVETY
jgi:hypothetical protein